MPIIRANSLDLHYVWMGESYDPDGPPPIMLIHGLATNLAFWIPFAFVFPVKNPLLLVDLRGHGRSAMPGHGYTVSALARDLESLLEALGISSVHLLGHSYGGSVAVEFAASIPERCLSLMLADARIRMFQPIQRPQDWPNWPQLQERLACIGIVVRDDQDEAGYYILQEMARISLKLDGMPDWPKRISEVMGGGFSIQTATRWLKLVEETTISSDMLMPESASVEVLRNLSIPVFSVYGSRSPVLKSAEGVASIWPEGDHHRIENVGHFFPLTQAKMFSGLVQSFMETL